MNKIEIKDAYFTEDNSTMIIEAKCGDVEKEVKFTIINNNFRKILEFLNSEIFTRKLFETICNELKIYGNDIEYSKEDFEKLKDLIEIA